jgi:hypothetical protein
MHTGQGLSSSSARLGLSAFVLARASLRDDTWHMGEWIGLIGVVAGALIALSGQYATRSADTQERTRTLLLEQFAVLIALSEDYRNRVWEERTQVAMGVVAAWDLGTYRLAEARLRVMCRDAVLLRALDTLHEQGKALGKAWRLEPRDEADVASALKDHRAAIEQFVAASARVVGGSSRSPIGIPLTVRRRRLNAATGGTAAESSQAEV